MCCHSSIRFETRRKSVEKRYLFAFSILLMTPWVNRRFPFETTSIFRLFDDCSIHFFPHWMECPRSSLFILRILSSLLRSFFFYLFSCVILDLLIVAHAPVEAKRIYLILFLRISFSSFHLFLHVHIRRNQCIDIDV